MHTAMLEPEPHPPPAFLLSPDEANAEKDINLRSFSLDHDKYQAAVAIPPPNEKPSEGEKNLTGGPGNQGENLYNVDQVLDEDSLQEAIKKIKIV